MRIKGILTFISVCVALYAVWFAWFSLNLGSFNNLYSWSESGEESETIKAWITPIVFMVAWQSFPGAIYFKDSIDEWDTVSDGMNSLECGTSVDGLYYSEPRWSRLRPLNNQSASGYGYDQYWLNFVTGALYTDCDGTVNGNSGYDYGIFGKVRHELGNEVYTGLVSGLKYTGSNVIGWINTVIAGSALSNSLMRIQDKEDSEGQRWYPVGLIYDEWVGGIWFVGCRPAWSGDVELVISEFNKWVDKVVFFSWGANNAFWTGALSGKITCDVWRFENKQLEWLIKILGLIGQSSDSTGDVSSVALGAQLFPTVKVNNATLINEAKRNADALCRWNWESAVVWRSTKEINCVNNGVVKLDDYIGKTLIVQGKDVNVSSDYLRKMDQQPVDLFIDGGNLVLEQTETLNGLVSFDAKGNPVSIGGVSSWELLKGNFVINWLIQWNSGDNKSQVIHKLFIHWKFTSLNINAQSGAAVVNTRINQLWGNVDPRQVSLEEVFSRRCKNSKWSDRTDCKSSNDKEYFQSPLVIINQNYPSKLIK